MDYFPLVLGSILLAISVGFTVQQLRFLRGTRKTYGALVSWKEMPTLSRRPLRKSEIAHGASSRVQDYYAIVSFAAADGSIHTITSSIGVWPKPAVEIGHRYAVRYSPREPGAAQIDTIGNFWLRPLIFLLFGGFLIFAAFHPHHRH